MKRSNVILIFVCLFGFVTVQGQFIRHFGLKAGISVANQSYLFTPIETLLPTDALLRPGVVFFMEAFDGDHVSMQMDIGYVPKGNRTTAQSITINHMDNDRIVVNEGPLITSIFHYLTFSPMVRYRQDMEKVVFYTLLGPRVDYLLNYSTNSDFPLEYQSEILIGLTGAFGLEYKFEKLNAFSEIQYQPDLSPLTSHVPLMVNNNCLFLTIGVRY
jgi:hypothetical protein